MIKKILFVVFVVAFCACIITGLALCFFYDKGTTMSKIGGVLALSPALILLLAVIFESIYTELIES